MSMVGEDRDSFAGNAYESAGEHELKGKTEPMTLWRALRVVSGVGGALKSSGLEAPFVGRHRELKLIKDLFHGCAQERRAHLVREAPHAIAVMDKIGGEHLQRHVAIEGGVVGSVDVAHCPAARQGHDAIPSDARARNERLRA